MSTRRTLSPGAARALADAAPTPFWTDRPDRPEARPPLRGLAARTDLLIVGGGFTGLWAAVQAKEDDPAREVVVIEAGRLADSASGRNGGFVAPSLTHGLAGPGLLAPRDRYPRTAGGRELREHRADARGIRHRCRLPCAG